MNTYSNKLLNCNLSVPIAKKQLCTDHIIKPSNISISLFFKLMSLSIIFSFVITTSSQAANLLFRSNFGTGVSLTMPTAYYTKGAWQYITGTDKETGYSWPVSALGSNFSGVQLLTVDPIDSSSISNYITNEVRTVIGPKGSPINELFQNVKINGAL